MMLLPIYRSAVHQFDSRVRAIRPEQWSLSTPDDGWDVHRLVRHVIAGQVLVPATLTGASGPSGSYVHEAAERSGPELVAAWDEASKAAVAAFTEFRSWGSPILVAGAGLSPEDYGWRLVNELTVHAWDLARAIDGSDEFPNDLLANVLEKAKESANSWLATGRYAQSIPVPGCTDDLTELLALTGRNRWWRRS
jgi:uncharacterized protein (TIGR03086 family)